MFYCLSQTANEIYSLPFLREQQVFCALGGLKHAPQPLSVKAIHWLSGHNFLILLFNFVLIRVMPGDPMLYILGEEDYYDFYYNNPEYLEQLCQEYDLDGSILHQFGLYWRNILHLDFGTSYHYGRPVLDLILFRASWTLRLVLPAVLLAALLGGPAGTSGRVVLRAVGGTAGHACPYHSPHYTDLLLINYSAVYFCLPPGMAPTGRNGIRRKERGGLCMGYALAHDAALNRPGPLQVSYDYLILRSSVREIREEPYITTAFSKGLSQRVVLFRHVLPNALLPYVTAVCLQFGAAVAGTMTMEVMKTQRKKKRNRCKYWRSSGTQVLPWQHIS